MKLIDGISWEWYELQRAFKNWSKLWLEWCKTKTCQYNPKWNPKNEIGLDDQWQQAMRGPLTKSESVGHVPSFTPSFTVIFVLPSSTLQTLFNGNFLKKKIENKNILFIFFLIYFSNYLILFKFKSFTMYLLLLGYHVFFFPKIFVYYWSIWILPSCCPIFSIYI